LCNNLEHLRLTR